MLTFRNDKFIDISSILLRVSLNIYKVINDCPQMTATKANQKQFESIYSSEIYSRLATIFTVVQEQLLSSFNKSSFVFILGILWRFFNYFVCLKPI